MPGANYSGKGVTWGSINVRYRKKYEAQRVSRFEKLKHATTGVLQAIRKTLDHPNVPYEVPKTKRRVCRYKWQVFDTVANELLRRARVNPVYYDVLRYFAGLLVVCALDRVYDIHKIAVSQLNYGHQVVLVKVTSIALKMLDVLVVHETDTERKEHLNMLRAIAVWAQYISSFTDENMNLKNDKTRYERMAHHHVKYVENTRTHVKDEILRYLKKSGNRNRINDRATYLASVDTLVETLFSMLDDVATPK